MELIGYLCARCEAEHLEAMVGMTRYEPHSKYGLRR